MKYRLLAYLLLSLFTTTIIAQVSTDCSVYKMSTSVIRDTLRFDLSQNGTVEVPHVDSVWITTSDLSELLLFRGIIQPREPIDISLFERGYYLLWVQVGDCLYGARFGKQTPLSGCAGDYNKIECSVRPINPHRIVLSVIDTATNQPIAWDSVWITNQAWRAKPEILLKAFPQDGDTIDIAPMVGVEWDIYMCWIQIGECIKTANFTFSGAEWDPCLEYQDVAFYVRVQNEYTELQYFVYNPKNVDIPTIDSVWVENKAREVVFVSYAQPDEIIDISSLPTGIYSLTIQVDGCVTGRVFYVRRKSTQDVDQVTTSSSATKFFRDGQVLILRGEKAYTVTGQEVNGLKMK